VVLLERESGAVVSLERAHSTVLVERACSAEREPGAAVLVERAHGWTSLS
jgi:hypothetical protein